jgi:4-aminobutyrate aminotransferase-like enzyme
MFGHSPAAVAAAVAGQAARGLTCMLPAARTAQVGAALASRFSLPYWQLTQTATDANRAALRWARALTRRRIDLGSRRDSGWRSCDRLCNISAAYAQSLLRPSQ